MTDNELIAEFDGWIRNPDYNKGSRIQWTHPKYSTKLSDTLYIPTTPESMKYATSWDWLMPVVEKIKSGSYGREAFGSVHIYIQATGFRSKWNCSILGSLTYQVPINRTQHTYSQIDIPHISVYCEEDNRPIVCTLKAVIEFIRWYNIQSK